MLKTPVTLWEAGEKSETSFLAPEFSSLLGTSHEILTIKTPPFHRWHDSIHLGKLYSFTKLKRGFFLGILTTMNQASVAVATSLWVSHPKLPLVSHLFTQLTTSNQIILRQGWAEKSALSGYPLVNVCIANWKSTMLFSWVNPLFRLGHFS